MKVEVLIQHHPARAALLPALLRRFGGRVRAVPDPDPDARLPSPWRTYRACLEAVRRDTTHLIVLQDDVEPCAGFEQAAAAALAARPDSLVTFFVAATPYEYSHEVWQAAEDGQAWARLGNSRWAPAIALGWPAPMIGRLLAFIDAQDYPPEFRADDEIIGRFLRDAGEDLWATVPCLVQHPDEEPSLLGRPASAGGNLDRVATCWNPGCDATQIDWTA